MAKNMKDFHDSSLDKVYDKCVSKMDKTMVCVASGYPNYDVMNSEHDSGFDAYKTGKAFAIMMHLSSQSSSDASMPKGVKKEQPPKKEAIVQNESVTYKTPEQLVEESGFKFI